MELAEIGQDDMPDVGFLNPIDVRPVMYLSISQIQFHKGLKEHIGFPLHLLLELNLLLLRLPFGFEALLFLLNGLAGKVLVAEDTEPCPDVFVFVHTHSYPSISCSG